MNNQEEIKRQAVIVIHGMGEQRPMDTLRSFVKGLKQVMEESDAKEKNSTLRSKPDSIGNIYETVRLSMDSTSSRPITDFYEFYWAHNMRDTKINHMLTWMYRLIFSTLKNVPPRLKSLWISVWLIILLIPLLIFFTMYLKGIPISFALSTSLATATLLPSLFSICGSFIKNIFLRSAGDAARYFTPDPDNIGERSRIREQGIEFLEKLHKIGSYEKVDRIIIVAHSLGSVVAYDLLRLLWTEYNNRHKQPTEFTQEKLEEINLYANGSIPLNNDNIDMYRRLQFECWMEQRKIGNPWLITDFITLGAAINAVDYFMVTNDSIENLIRQREIPVSPPAKDLKENAIIYKDLTAPRDARSQNYLKILNHGALFAVTRWTNIFYRSDYVGGPMQRVFGPGVKDIIKERKCFYLYPGGHTQYWNIKDKNNSLSEIMNAMQLNTREND